MLKLKIYLLKKTTLAITLIKPTLNEQCQSFKREYKKKLSVSEKNMEAYVFLFTIYNTRSEQDDKLLNYSEKKNLEQNCDLDFIHKAK